MIKIIKNKNKRFHRKQIMELTKLAHYYEHDEYGHEVRIYNKRYMDIHDKYTYLVSYNSSIVGMFSIHKYNDGDYYLWRVFIKEEYRNLGIGTETVNWVKRIFNKGDIFIEVNNDEQIKSFYDKLGFEETRKDNIYSYMTYKKEVKHEN